MEGKEVYFAFASNLSERKMKERGAKFTSPESQCFADIASSSPTGKMMVLVTLISPQTKVPRFMALYTSARREACVKWITSTFMKAIVSTE